MASAMGAGLGADMLQEVLKRKLVEQAQLAQQAQFAQKLAEDARQANQQNDVARGGLTLGNRRVDEDSRQFNEQAPTRMALIGRTNAETSELQRKPQAEQQQRDFTLGRDKSTQDFTTGRDKAEHGYRLGEIGAQGANALRVATANNETKTDLAGQKAAKQDQNEVDDSIALVDRILNDKALPGAVGPVNQYGLGWVSDPEGINRFQALHNELVGKLSLAQAGKLRGQGQISDKERAMLANAATALTRGMGQQDYKNELANIRAQFTRMRSGAPATAPAGGKGGGFTVVEIK